LKHFTFIWFFLIYNYAYCQHWQKGYVVNNDETFLGHFLTDEEGNIYKIQNRGSTIDAKNKKYFNKNSLIKLNRKGEIIWELPYSYALCQLAWNAEHQIALLATISNTFTIGNITIQKADLNGEVKVYIFSINKDNSTIYNTQYLLRQTVGNAFFRIFSYEKDRIYLGGELHNKVYVISTGDSIISETMNMGATTENPYVIAFSNTGQYIWHRKYRSLYGSSQFISYGLVNLNNTIIVAGLAGFESDTSQKQYNSRGNKAFLSQIDSLGNELGRFYFNKNIRSHVYIRQIIYDIKGNVYVIGEFKDILQFKNLKYSAISTDNFFLLKLDSTLTPLWVQTSEGNGWATGMALALDRDMNIFVTGIYFGGSKKFNNIISPDLNNYNMFINRYASNGNLLNAYFPVDSNHVIPNRIEINACNRLYLSGHVDIAYNKPGIGFGNLWLEPDSIKSTGIKKSMTFMVYYDLTYPDFNKNISSCNDTLRSIADSAYTTFNWFMNDSVYIGSGKKLKIPANINFGKHYIKLVASGAKICDKDYSDTVAYVDERPDFSLGNDTSICFYDSILFKCNVYGKYLWSTNDTSVSIIVKRASNYSVQVTDTFGCIATDTLKLKHFPYKKLNLDTDKNFCSDNNGSVFIDVQGYNTYVWMPSGENTAGIDAYHEGTYTLHTTDTFGCKQSDSILIYDQCPPKIFIPNSFTPNRDGLNDRFKPVTTFIAKYEWSIFNRWGLKVYSGTENDQGWDGTYNGMPVLAETYIYILTWWGNKNFTDIKSESISGEVTLWR